MLQTDNLSLTPRPGLILPRSSDSNTLISTIYLGYFPQSTAIPVLTEDISEPQVKLYLTIVLPEGDGISGAGRGIVESPQRAPVGAFCGLSCS